MDNLVFFHNGFISGAYGISATGLTVLSLLLLYRDYKSRTQLKQLSKEKEPETQCVN